MATLQTVINLARENLNDLDKVRHADVQLLKFANNGIQEMVKFRPDLFLGQYQNADKYYALIDIFPMSAMYERAIADYIIGRAEMTNTEESSIARAGALLSLAGKEGGVS